MDTPSLNWTKIGEALRESALDAHQGGLPPLQDAWQFLLGNAEMQNPAFGVDEWPAEPPVELMAAYYQVELI
jgi:hypothetical protein